MTIFVEVEYKPVVPVESTKPVKPAAPKKRKKRRSRSAMDIAAEACGLVKVRSASGKVYYE